MHTVKRLDTPELIEEASALLHEVYIQPQECQKLEVNETLPELEYLENDVGNDAQSIFKALQTVGPILPTPFYWMNAQGVVLGINELALKAIGTTHEIIGMKPYAFYRPEIAEHILQHNEEVMRKEAILTQEEWIEDVTTKNRKCFSSIKAPLYDSGGVVIGIVGTSIEITAQKEVELLKLENERQRSALLQEKEKLITLACKVAHDINSPLVALKILSERCGELPENKRSLLIRATESILDIANNLINNYQQKDSAAAHEMESRQPLLVSDLLLQLLSEKKVQYLRHSVKFETEFADDAYFAFTLMQKTEFRRAMSNLINNAVDALEGKEGGTITIQLTADTDTVIIKVQDNGKGMSRDKVEKMLEHRCFTDKENGHGLGLQQVWDTLKYNLGTMEVHSTLDEGTAILLSFPRIAAATWIAQEIHLIPDDIIVVLDDDEAIHKAWHLRFTSLLTSHPSLRLHHFTQGQEVLDFLAKMSREEKNRVVFLSDYELLHQDKNGLQIIAASGIKHAMLVTSYYSDQKIQSAASQLGVKILPKQMVAVIPVFVSS